MNCEDAVASEQYVGLRKSSCSLCCQLKNAKGGSWPLSLRFEGRPAATSRLRTTPEPINANCAPVEQFDVRGARFERIEDRNDDPEGRSPACHFVVGMQPFAACDRVVRRDGLAARQGFKSGAGRLKRYGFLRHRQPAENEPHSAVVIRMIVWQKHSAAEMTNLSAGLKTFMSKNTVALVDARRLASSGSFYVPAACKIPAQNVSVQVELQE